MCVSIYIKTLYIFIQNTQRRTNTYVSTTCVTWESGHRSISTMCEGGKKNCIWIHSAHNPSHSRLRRSRTPSQDHITVWVWGLYIQSIRFDVLMAAADLLDKISRRVSFRPWCRIDPGRLSSLLQSTQRGSLSIRVTCNIGGDMGVVLVKNSQFPVWASTFTKITYHSAFGWRGATG